MNYYRFYVGDYLRDTAHLSIMEHGAYNLMLGHCYATEKPLPQEYDALYRLCRAMSRPEQDAVRKIADEFFKVGADGFRHNPRADREIGVARATIAKQKESGVQSALKRWGKDKSTDGSTYDDVNRLTHELTDESTHELTGKSAIQPPTTNHQPPALNHQKSKSMSDKPSVKTLTDLGVDEQIAKDWLAVRKAKRAPLTDTVIKSLVSEAGKAGISIAEAVAICARKSWQGFDASWKWQDSGAACGFHGETI